MVIVTSKRFVGFGKFRFKESRITTLIVNEFTSPRDSTTLLIVITPSAVTSSKLHIITTPACSSKVERPRQCAQRLRKSGNCDAHV